MTMGSILLAVFLILWGLDVCLHLALPGVVLGILALVTGILLLVGK